MRPRHWSRRQGTDSIRAAGVNENGSFSCRFRPWDGCTADSPTRVLVLWRPGAGGRLFRGKVRVTGVDSAQRIVRVDAGPPRHTGQRIADSGKKPPKCCKESDFREETQADHQRPARQPQECARKTALRRVLTARHRLCGSREPRAAHRSGRRAGDVSGSCANMAGPGTGERSIGGSRCHPKSCQGVPAVLSRA